jgi:hypothetical protein
MDNRKVISIKGTNGLVTRYFLNDDGTTEMCPLSTTDIANKCTLNYTNKEGKVYYTQIGDTAIVLNDGKAIVTHHKCAMGKGEKEKKFVAIWDVDKVRMGEKIFPALKMEIGDSDTDTIIHAIKNLA